jgi:transposase, IS30 family
MAKSYRRLSLEDRETIAVLKQSGVSVRSIAKRLGRDPGTISRELERNSGKESADCYLPHKAQGRADELKTTSHRRARLSIPGLQAYVRRQITRGWSPERIAGRWNKTRRKSTSHEAIYAWIYSEAKELIRSLPCAHRKRRRQCRVRGKKFIPIPSRKPISERPKAAADRRQAGHWEADLVLGPRQRSVLQLIVERKTRYVRVKRLKGKTAKAVRSSINRSLAQYPKHMRRTITFDNGRENVEHALIDLALGTRSYFCEPMHSWEKGSVENAAGLIRRRLPRKTDFGILPIETVRQLQRWLNGLPRKCLGYQTAEEAFRASVALAR